MMSETFYVGLYSALMGFVLAISAQCYKSKCSQVELCCIKIVRDTTKKKKKKNQQRPQNPIQSQKEL